MAWTAPATKSTGTLVTAAVWNEQITNNMTWLGTSHDHNGGAGDGGALAVVSGLIAIFDAACPTGWTRVSAWDSKMIRGAAAYGATGGADTHTHTGPSHTHTYASHTHSVAAHTHNQITGGDTVNTAGGAIVVAATVNNSAMHTGITSGSTEALMNSGAASGGSGTSGAGSAATTDAGGTGATGSGSSLPAYIAVVFCKKD